MEIVGKNFQKACIRAELSNSGNNTPPPAGGGGIAISASVGAMGKNLPNDTITVQDALNRVPPGQGEALPPLIVDGQCGPKTKNAIKTFQLKHFGWQGADSLIEPNKQTIAKLNELVGSPGVAKAAPLSPAAAAIIMPNPLCFPLARDFILAAETNLLAASLVLEQPNSSGGLSIFSRESKMKLLNKHFDIDSFGINANKRKVFNIIQNVFARMRQVFERPGGLWGSATFEPDPTNWTPYAYTNFGGFFRGGQFRYHKGIRIRLDSVYICSPFSNLTDPAEQAIVIIHELAHFVGNPELIDDHAYNFQGDKVKKLPPNLKLLNAENYMNFAWEAKRGTDAPNI